MICSAFVTCDASPCRVLRHSWDLVPTLRSAPDSVKSPRTSAMLTATFCPTAAATAPTCHRFASTICAVICFRPAQSVGRTQGSWAQVRCVPTRSPLPSRPFGWWATSRLTTGRDCAACADPCGDPSPHDPLSLSDGRFLLRSIPR